VMGGIGCAVHVGWLAIAASGRPRPDSLLASHALGCDARLPLASWLELRGEAYGGQLMRGLGGGAIGQGLGAGGRPIRNSAGWAQLNLRPPGIWSAGAGCGVDDPRDSDVVQDAAARLRNSACAIYAIVRPAGPVFVGAEVRRIDTKYVNTSFLNSHLNLAFGFEF
jgi:hypothetical protein